MSTFKHELLLASAGTGKTFRLTNQFLRLLLAGVEPERVLATTFTRKAAGEILDRVLQRIVDAADSAQGLEDLRDAIEEESLTSDQCRALLVKLTRGLDTFQVRTIDSFFAHLVRLFAHDLDVPPNWSISDVRADEALQSGAMQDVLESAERGEMIELLRDLQKGGAGRGVQATLLARAKNLRPIALESAEGAWRALHRGDAIDESTFDRARQELPGAPLAQTASGGDMKNWVKARDQILTAIEAHDWQLIFSKGLGAASLQDEPSYYSKPLSPELLEVLVPIVEKARCEVLNELVARNEAVHALLDRFEASYARRKRDAGQYHFDDLPMALAPETARARLFDEREADLWFRLDSRLDHLLLDEFQDTSPVQWRILAPLASEITSTGGGERSFFCVGDTKQSIYGFRQAEPRLLESLESLLPGLRAEFMDKSYRSSSVVLDLVNLVFGDITNNRTFEGEGHEPHRAAAQAWSTRFGPHVAAKTLPGVVHVVEARRPIDGEPPGRAAIICAVERVARILEEAPRAKVGVLTRVNQNIPTLIHALRDRGIDASGEGGNALTDSEAVLVYISLLHLADHPGDSAAAFHVLTSRFGSYIDLAPDAAGDVVHQAARQFRADLIHRGLGEVTSDFAKQVHRDSSWSDWDKARFTQLGDQAFAFEDRLALRASEFVDHLRTNRVEAPGGARVRVMTIHSSKGLEFDAVVLPELSASLVGRRDAYLVERPDPTGLITAVMLSPGKDLLSLSPELERLYNSVTQRSVEDSLCNLYVAMTRAKRRIEMIVPFVDPTEAARSTTPTYATLIREALPAGELLDGHAEGDADGNVDGLLWRSIENSSPDAWGKDLQGPKDDVTTPEPELTLAATTAPRFARRRAASSEVGSVRVTAQALLRTGSGAEVGTLVHAAFEGCEWLEDFKFNPGELDQHGASAEIVRSACRIVEGALASEEIRAALSRECCDAPPGAHLRVEREHEFSLFLEDPPILGNDAEGPQFWNGAIDRLVVAEADGRAIWAEVIDFKSDSVGDGDGYSASELQQKAEGYRPQLEAYARVVSEQTGLAADAVRMRLAFTSIGRVATLTSIPKL